MRKSLNAGRNSFEGENAIARAMGAETPRPQSTEKPEYKIGEWIRFMCLRMGRVLGFRFGMISNRSDKTSHGCIHLRLDIP
jgi:hypothetical protein